MKRYNDNDLKRPCKTCKKMIYNIKFKPYCNECRERQFSSRTKGIIPIEVDNTVKIKNSARIIQRSVRIFLAKIQLNKLKKYQEELEAKQKNIEIEKASFPWAASGRALSNNRSEGTTKLIFNKQTHRLIGAGITGVNAGELIAETVLAIEMGADAHDLGLTIHPHPTLSETVCFAAEVKEGTITDLYIKKR